MEGTRENETRGLRVASRPLLAFTFLPIGTLSFFSARRHPVLLLSLSGERISILRDATVYRVYVYIVRLYSACDEFHGD